MSGFETRIRELERVETSDEQAGADEQRQRERGLEPDERRRAPGRAAVSCCVYPARHGDRAGASRRAQRSRRTNDVHASERMAPATNVRKTDADLGRPRHAGRRGGADEKVAGPHRHREPGDRGDEADDEVLGDELSHDPRPAGAEREPGGELVLPLQRAADEQSRGIAARDEQERDDRGGKRVQRGTNIARQLFAQARDGRARAGFVSGCSMASAPARAVSSARACSTVTPGRRRPMTRSIRASRRPTFGIEAEGHPHLRHARPHRRRMKTLGEDADERVRPAAQEDRLPDGAGIAADSAASRAHG